MKAFVSAESFDGCPEHFKFAMELVSFIFLIIIIILSWKTHSTHAHNYQELTTSSQVYKFTSHKLVSHKKASLCLSFA